jgi:intein/homing endonuclease
MVEVDFTPFTPEKYLLSHATIVGGVEPCRDHGYIVTPHGKHVNDNGNAWWNQVVLESYTSFLLAYNFAEHIQAAEMAKGFVLDAVAWVVEETLTGEREPVPTVFVDILVATHRRRHPELVQAIESKKLRTLSMGTEILKSQCSRCLRVFVEDEDNPCDHIVRGLGQWFVGKDGKKHRQAEMCGVAGEPGTNTWTECCVHGDTEILTSRGLMTAQQLQDCTDPVLTEYGVKEHAGVRSMGRRPLYRLRLKSGNNIYVTHNHRFKVQGDDGLLDWRQVIDIHPGDMVLAQRGDHGLIPEDRGGDSDFWFAVGAFYGDGSYQNKGAQKRWVVRYGEEEILDRIEGWLIREGYQWVDREVSREERGRPQRLAYQRDKVYSIALQKAASDATRNSSVPLHILTTNHPALERVIPPYQRDGDWRNAGLPKELTFLGKRQLGAFLNGLFSTDGYCSQTSPHMGLVTKRRKMAQDTQKYLRLLGITSTILRKKTVDRHRRNPDSTFRPGKAYHVKIVSSRSRERFRDWVGFTVESKQERLEVLAAREGVIKRDKYGYFRAGVLLRRIFPSVIPGPAQDRAAKSIRQARRNNGTISDTMAQVILEKCVRFGHDPAAIQLLRDFVEQDWYFEEVVSVTPCGEAEVFDPINVKDTSSYVSNGLISHNSWVNVPAFTPAERHHGVLVGERSVGRPLRGRVPEERWEDVQERLRRWG